jgi:hypothetical protein
MDGEDKERETDILAVSDYEIFHNLENTRDRKSHTSDSYEIIWFLQYAWEGDFKNEIFLVLVKTSTK